MWSQYLRVRKKGGVVAIFHELHPDPIYCSSERWKQLADGIVDGDESLIDNFKQRKLIVKSYDGDIFVLNTLLSGYAFYESLRHKSVALVPYAPLTVDL
jgi:hypothetical protein